MFKRWYYRIKAAIENWYWRLTKPTTIIQKLSIPPPVPKQVQLKVKKAGVKHRLHRAHFGTFSPCKPLSMRYANDR